MELSAHFSPRGRPSPRWTVTRGGRVVYQDSAQHATLTARVLDIDEEAWRAVLDRYEPASDRLDEKLLALQQAIVAALPSDTTMLRPASQLRDSTACPVCGGATTVALTRRIAGDGGAPIVYSRCAACQHLSLVCGAEPDSTYTRQEYYSARAPNGAGYHAYGDERAYREAKGRRIVQWLSGRGSGGRRQLSGRGNGGRRLLEVGSGFGYTRKAAQDAGWVTGGVDLSAYASDQARALYGMQTQVGSLAACLVDGRIARRSWDLALYQFVIEHISDPLRELRAAAETLVAGGLLALILPSADAAEIDIFQGRYRSLRADHLHVFSSRSLELTLRASGFAIVESFTTCSVHLLRGFLDDEALEDLYRRGRGPDRYLLARKVGG